MVDLNKINTKPETICSIDASTNSLAFAIFSNMALVKYGKINFQGRDTYAKVADAAAKTAALFKLFDIDAVLIEQTVYLNSPKTMMDLTMVHGAIIAALTLGKDISVKSVPPITWQTFIGNGKLTVKEKQDIILEFPNKTKNWYQNKSRQIRKQKTINFVNIYYDKSITDDDVADAIGIGNYACKNVSKLF
jgi:Holliday junction resolvasome RuvABC endonuclease subunit